MTQFQHPDDDLLADFAADVLPLEEAGPVDTHVRSCEICLAVLADAETVRSALLQIPLEPMPDDILARIQSAIGIELDARTGTATEHPIPKPSHTAWDDTEAFTSVMSPASGAQPGGNSERASSAVRAQATREPAWTPGDPDDAPLASIQDRGSRPGTKRRMRNSEVPRQRRVQPLQWLGLAAGVLVVAGVGYVAVRPPGFVKSALSATAGVLGSKASSASGASVPARASVDGTPDAAYAGKSHIVRTTLGTAYVTARFSEQAKVLLAASTRADASTHYTADNALGSPLATDDGVAACLKAMSVSGATVLSVDFGTFDGAQAAVLLTSVDGANIQAWAVAPDCGQGSQAALGFAEFDRSAPADTTASTP